MIALDIDRDRYLALNRPGLPGITSYMGGSTLSGPTIDRHAIGRDSHDKRPLAGRTARATPPRADGHQPSRSARLSPAPRAPWTPARRAQWSAMMQAYADAHPSDRAYSMTYAAVHAREKRAAARAERDRLRAERRVRMAGESA